MSEKSARYGPNDFSLLENKDHWSTSFNVHNFVILARNQENFSFQEQHAGSCSFNNMQDHVHVKCSFINEFGFINSNKKIIFSYLQADTAVLPRSRM